MKQAHLPKCIMGEKAMRCENFLQQARQQRGVLIAAHRGVSGGNIPFNTIKAFEAALCQGADILETDITSRKDGKLFVLGSSGIYS